METILLGRTGIRASKIGFGALPLQRRDMAEAVRILQKAYDSGINFYDTARFYTDSEEKIGEGLSAVRGNIFIASKVSGAQTGQNVTDYIENSLKNLRTDHIDIMQFHNPDFVPLPGGQNGMYDAMLKAREQGKIRFIGFTNHKLTLIDEALKSGLYDTLQYPISYISTDDEMELISRCEKSNVGLLAMKPLGGGLLSNAAAVFHFYEQHKNGLLPLYGVQHMHELEEFLSFEKNPPEAAHMDDIIARDRAELKDNFCRGCGYCMPCPEGITLNMVCRMYHLLNRAPVSEYVTQHWYDEMQKTLDCRQCGACNPRCPYDFNPQTRLKQEYEYFMKVYNEFHGKD